MVTVSYIDDRRDWLLEPRGGKIVRKTGVFHLMRMGGEIVGYLCSHGVDGGFHRGDTIIPLDCIAAVIPNSDSDLKGL